MTLTGLLERLEAADGTDRELDVAIIETFGAVFKYFEGAYEDDCGEWTWPSGIEIRCISVTSSIDAAVQLAGEVLPGLKCELVFGYEVATAQFFTGEPGGYFNQIVHKTPALALCTAIVKARIEQEKETG